jgi:hypothetical protein
MRLRESFRRWRNTDHAQDRHEQAGEGRGSGALSGINRLWRRKPGGLQWREGTDGSSGSYARPLSHGLF